MPGMIGKKIGMTSLFDENGKNLPCTVIEVEPNVVTQIKTAEKDGYEAVQLAYGEQKESRVPAAMVGHFKKAGVSPRKKVKEFDLILKSDNSFDFNTQITGTKLGNFIKKNWGLAL